MADPLSLVASVIAIAGVARATAKGIDKIVSKRHAPTLLLQLANEISELNVLLQIATDFATGKSNAVHHDLHQSLVAVLDRAKGTVDEVHHFIKYELIKEPQSLEDDVEKVQVRWHVWARREGRLRSMIKRLSIARSTISSALTALTATSVNDLRSVHVDLSNVELIKEGLITSLQNMEAGIAKRLDDMRLGMPSQYHSEPSSLDVSSLASEEIVAPPQYEAGPIVKTRSTSNLVSCTCQCHSPLSGKSPSWLGSSIGMMLVRYNRPGPQSCPACKRRLCEKDGKSFLNTQYYFPSWLLHRMLALQYSWDPLAGHRLALRSQRSIPSRSNVFSLAQHGNIEGIKRLFEHRLASPLDVSLEEGRSALHFAMTATQPGMVAFLLSQGADPRLEDRNMLSAYDVCWNYLLQMPGNKDLENLLTSAGLTMSDKESLENRNFSPLHRIVLGLSSLDLRSYLETTTVDLDAKDSLGKTPLCWAASRPDTSMVETLVEFGASLRIGDHRKQSPLHYSAGSGKPRSTEIILDAASKEQQHQSRSSECSHLQELIDARDSKGRTPLTFAARMNFPEHAKLLLSHGADPEAIDSWLDRSALLSAIYWKSSQVIPVLLEHGSRTDVVDAKNANVLHYAARYGDMDTLKILSGHSLGRLDTEAADDSGMSPWRIFESPTERCVHEAGAAALESLRALQSILDQAAGRFEDGHTIIEEVVDIKEDEDIFIDAGSHFLTEPTDLSEPSTWACSEPKVDTHLASESNIQTIFEMKNGVG